MYVPSPVATNRTWLLALLLGACVDLRPPAAVGDAAPGERTDGGGAIAGTCTSSAGCSSGFCADGVCCDRACQGPCEACNLTGTSGTCSPIPVGEDPTGDCAPEPAGTCGRDGMCDGRGSCRLHAAGTVCAPGACSGSTASAERTCDGAGACRAAATKRCDPYVCAGAACGQSCSGNAGCVQGSSCGADSTCAGRLPSGSVCAAANDCNSGVCADGVCCESACAGPCVSCNLPGSAGVCAPVPAGQDPGDDCAIMAGAPCGQDGTCDGNGQCRLALTGTTCEAALCSGGTERSARTCDGQGTCRTAATRACTPFACGATACKTTCTQDGDCASGHFCSGGACQAKRTAGATCDTDRECGSGFCTSGVCCNARCDDACSVCNAAGAVGTCVRDPAPTLVGHWKLDETSGSLVSDASCAGNTGALQGTATGAWSPMGRRGGALQSGADRAVRVPSSASLNSLGTSRAFTVASWVYRIGTQGMYATLLARQHGTGTTNHFHLSLRDEKPRLAVADFHPENPDACSAAAQVPDRTWTHLAGVWDGATATLYVNGVAACSFAHAGGPNADTTPIHIGADSNASSGTLNERLTGMIDDVVLYRRALGRQEIESLAAGNAPPVR